MSSWLDNRELDRIYAQTDYPWRKCPTANISRLYKATGLSQDLAIQVLTPRILPIILELGQNSGAKNVLPG